jgi:hypothetical protein
LIEATSNPNDFPSGAWHQSGTKLKTTRLAAANK